MRNAKREWRADQGWRQAEAEILASIPIIACSESFVPAEPAKGNLRSDEIVRGLSLALIGNASGGKPPVSPDVRCEAFSIRRQGGSRWCLRQMRGYGD